MIAAFKAVVRRHWPRLGLRTILLVTFLFVAALPGFGALFLRVYENTLVRQTEAELIAQGAALAAAGSVAWRPDGAAPAMAATIAGTPSLDLRLSRILPDRPSPRPTPSPPEARATRWAARLLPVLRLTAEGTRAGIRLLDADGRILTGPDRGASWADLPEVRTALAGRPMTVLRRNGAYRPFDPLEWISRAADLRIHHAVPVIADGRVVGVLLLTRTPRALFAGLHADRGKILLGIAMIFATLVVLSGLLSRGIVRPVEALGEATRAVAGGRGGAAVPEPPSTAAIEIQSLYRDFGVMAEAIDRRSRYLRDFAHAVSHEFKTPLAGIGGATELLRDHPDMAPTDRQRFLANIAADAARLDLLVSRLLDLARADMTSAVAGSAIALPGVMQAVVDAFAGDRLTLTITAADALPTVAVPANVIEAVLTGLIDNSQQAGATRVALVAETSGRHVDMTITDNGAGIPPGDRERVFEPFFTSRRTSGGTGLGLPIARSLLEAHRGTIRLDDDAAPGSVFRLTLPVAE